MNRIAAGLLIVGAVLAMNAMTLRDTFAADAFAAQKAQAGRNLDVREIVETREGSRVLALVVALRAMSAQTIAIKG